MLIKFNKDKDSDDANDEVKDKDNDEVNVKMHWRKGEIGGGWSRPHGPNTFPHAILLFPYIIPIILLLLTIIINSFLL